jgi:alpha-beta hydrolase superfamily lysophospholipase
MSRLPTASLKDVAFALEAPEGALIFRGVRVADTISGTALLPSPVAAQQGAPSMTWRVVRRTPPAPPPYATREVRVVAPGATLAGTLFVPRNVTTRRAAVLILQGSSTNLRAQYRFQADRFVRAGFVVLTFDKRGNGESTGNYQIATFDDLVSDARAAFDTLSSQAEVDPQRVGLWGLSQGAFIAPLVARDKAAFVVAVSSPGMPISEAAAYQDSLSVAWSGQSEANAGRAAAVQRSLARVLSSQGPTSEFTSLLRGVARERWRPLTGLPRTTPPEEELRGWYWLGRTLDPVVWWRTLRVPVLLIYGAADELVPAAPSAERLAQALREGGNRDVTTRIYPRANHVVRLVASPLAPAGPRWAWPRPAPGYLDEVIRWTREKSSR